MSTPVAVPQLCLASSSPRRRDILAGLGLEFQVLVPEVDETPEAGEAPQDHVSRLARSKAEAGLALQGASGQCIVLGADTVVVAGGRILGKPETQQEHAEMLGMLSGSWHEVLTAVTIAGTERSAHSLSVSRVKLRTLDAQEISDYWQSGEPQDKAGGYAIQGLGGIFVERIEGNYSGIVGLPVFETVQMLAQWGLGPAHILRRKQGARA